MVRKGVRRGPYKPRTKPTKSSKEASVKKHKKENEEALQETEPIEVEAEVVEETPVLDLPAPAIHKCSECNEPVAPGQNSVCVKHIRAR